MAGFKSLIQGIFETLSEHSQRRYPSVQDIITESLNGREQLSSEGIYRNAFSRLDDSVDIIATSKSGEYIRHGVVCMPIEYGSYHGITFGVSGSGKTHLMNMQLSSVLDTLNKHPERRVVIYDYKGEAPAILAGHNVPYVVLSIDYQEGYVPDIAKDFDSDTELEQFAYELIPQSNSTQPFWENAARAVLAGAAKSFAYTQNNNFKIHDLFCLLKEDFPTLLRILGQHPDNGDVIHYILNERTEKTAIGVMSSLVTEMRKLLYVGAHSQHVGKHLSLKEFLFSKTSQAQVLVIAQRHTTREVTNPIVGMVFDRIASFLVDSPENKDVYGNEKAPWLFLFADELSSLPRLKKLREFVSVARSRGGAAFFATQGIGGLRKIYGDEEIADIVGNCSSKVFCKPPSDGVTPQWMSSVSGEKQYTEFVPTNVSIHPETGQISASASLNRYERKAFSSGDFLELPLAHEQSGVSAIFYYPFSNGGFREVVPPQVIEKYKRRRQSVAPFTPLSREMERIQAWSDGERRRFLTPSKCSSTISSKRVEPGSDPVFSSLGIELLAILFDANPNEPIGSVLKRCEAIVDKVWAAILKGKSEQEIQDVVEHFKCEGL